MPLLTILSKIKYNNEFIFPNNIKLNNNNKLINIYEIIK